MFEKYWFVFLAIGLGVFIVNLDGSLLAVALPVLENDFEVDTQVLQWVITAYFLVITSILPIVGKLSDLWGRKRVYITGVSIFTMASILCGISNSVEQLILFRVLQGFGGSMIMANAMSVITMVFPQNKRGIALGGITSITAIATVLGPGVGGYLISNFSWRSIFWINVPLAAVSILLTSFVLHTKSRKAEKAKIDTMGSFLFAIAMVSLLLFISNGNSWGWIGWASITSLVSSMAAWFLFSKWESTHTKPIINVELFRESLFTFGNIGICLSFILLTLPSILLPLYLNHYFAMTIAHIGYLLTVQAIAMILCSLISGWITDRTNPFIPALIGLGLTATGFIAMLFLNSHSNTVEIIVPLILLGAGIGLFQSPNNVLTLSKISDKDTGIAGGIMATMRNFGRVIGSAIAILIYNALRQWSLSLSVIIGSMLCVIIAVIMLISYRHMNNQHITSYKENAVQG